MRRLQQTVKAIVYPGDRKGYVAECVEIALVTQGRTIDETLKNLRKAVALHLEGEDASDFGLRAQPTVIVTMELDASYA